jgi:asparagine synthase (glutamine-hydrolysing)
MCGIAGLVALNGAAAPERRELRRMAALLQHRGPDAEGLYLAAPAGLAHRRLSIIDLAAGGQPMESEDGRLCVVFNGEIFNFLELRAELEGRGLRFRTRSDTEVLLALYQAEGLAAFARLKGMFACAFWERSRRRLVLARDRLGKKPLFYFHGARRFGFASELKALLASEQLRRDIDPAALHDYLTHGHIVGDASIIAGVSRLPPASLLVLEDGRSRVEPYWKLSFRPLQRPPPEAEAEAEVRRLLGQAVRRRMISDVPLGAFLSGGVDSSAVVALMARSSGRPVKTFTIGFEEQAYSELDAAREVARHLGTDHHEEVVHTQAVDLLPELVWHLDEPFADSSALPTYALCRSARREVTVAVSGDGGDEVFAGYAHYRQLGRYQKMLRVPRPLRRGLFRPLSQLLPFTWPGWNFLHALGSVKGGLVPSGLGIYPFVQQRLYSQEFTRQVSGVDPFASTERLLGDAAGLDPVSGYQYLDTREYLPADILVKVDRMSMANSLEVRSPLLDEDLVDYMAALPLSFKLRGETSKYLLRRISAPLLPASVQERPKQGFAIPKEQWFRGELHRFAEALLLSRSAVQRGYFRPAAVRRLLQHHLTGRRDYSNWIWCLLVLELWFRRFVDRAG